MLLFFRDDILVYPGPGVICGEVKTILDDVKTDLKRVTKSDLTLI